MTAKPVRCHCCNAAFDDDDHTLDARYDKFELPKVHPIVTRVERYSGTCRGCGATTLAPVPEGLEPGTPFSLDIMAVAIYLRVVHAISYQRLSRLFLDLFGLAISEGALDAGLRRHKVRVDAEVAAILARLRCSRVIQSAIRPWSAGGPRRRDARPPRRSSPPFARPPRSRTTCGAR